MTSSPTPIGRLTSCHISEHLTEMHCNSAPVPWHRRHSLLFETLSDSYITGSFRMLDRSSVLCTSLSAHETPRDTSQVLALLLLAVPNYQSILHCTSQASTAVHHPLLHDETFGSATPFQEVQFGCICASRAGARLAVSEGATLSGMRGPSRKLPMKFWQLNT